MDPVTGQPLMYVYLYICIESLSIYLYMYVYMFVWVLDLSDGPSHGAALDVCVHILMYLHITYIHVIHP